MDFSSFFSCKPQNYHSSADEKASFDVLYDRSKTTKQIVINLTTTMKQ